MPVAVAILPALTVLAVTFASVLPWGIHLSMEFRFLLPLVPYMLIHAWVMDRPRLMPEWFVFAIGILVDVLTHGPLGYWALVYLVGFAGAVLARNVARGGAMPRWASLAATLIVLGVVQWAVMSGFMLRRADWRPIAIATCVAIGCYPIIALLLTPLLRIGARRENPTLARGG